MTMRIAWGAVLTAAAMALPALAEPAGDLGRREFQANCAVCHGPGGRGDGVVRNWLTTPPSDLTTLARRAGGVFPADRVREVVDGRGAAVGAHGTREMPVWGDEYRKDAAARVAGTAASEDYVRSRIDALVAYLERLQSP
ncbi:MAG: cytochrome c [Rubrivivax sp.]|jgi:mono/diheme cytochrome c family protein|nr:cytochrome c [Rubrivivax sp.]